MNQTQQQPPLTEETPQRYTMRAKSEENAPLPSFVESPRAMSDSQRRQFMTMPAQQAGSQFAGQMHPNEGRFDHMLTSQQLHEAGGMHQQHYTQAPPQMPEAQSPLVINAKQICLAASTCSPVTSSAAFASAVLQPASAGSPTSLRTRCSRHLQLSLCVFQWAR